MRLKWPTDAALKAQMDNRPSAFCANVFTRRQAPYSAKLRCDNNAQVFTDLVQQIKDHKSDANYNGVRVGWRYVVRGRRWEMVSAPGHTGSKIHRVFVPRSLLPKHVADWDGAGA